MQTLINIALGAMLAAASLGPSAWAEAVQVNTRLLHGAAVLTGVEDAGSPLDRAVAKARAALPGQH
ncbi:MAG TPA: hypothetical protein VG889_05625 [Rhizomicrobium sp.]|nr:hypothetical protein [Rhizomicrobium sp.]